MARRTARRRRYLMCRPTHFEVSYSINPWMDPAKPVDRELAVLQWQRLRDLYIGLGHEVELIDPEPGLPDMVYAANGATVVHGSVLGANFRHHQRAGEGPLFLRWFREHGFERTRSARHVNEGEGDLLVCGDRILAGRGQRTSAEAHAEVEEFFGRPVVSLELVDPRYYHLDTALTVLDEGEIMYNPAAFSRASRAELRRLYPDSVLAGEHDAAVFGLNAVSDGLHVVLPDAAVGLVASCAGAGSNRSASTCPNFSRAAGVSSAAHCRSALIDRFLLGPPPRIQGCPRRHAATETEKEHAGE